MSLHSLAHCCSHTVGDRAELVADEKADDGHVMPLDRLGKGTQCEKLVKDYGFVHLSGPSAFLSVGFSYWDSPK